MSCENNRALSINDELCSSELGTKKYWDVQYEREINNYNTHGDVGEVWFGEDSEYRIIRWLKSCNRVDKSDSIVDIGCGNGMLLLELAKEKFTNLTGIDYSESAIELASKISSTQGFADISFKVYDIIKETSILDTFNIALDKGTYDAICLDPEDSKSKRITYKNNIAKLLIDDGLFIITSCNWTDKELAEFFKSHFTVLASIPAPSFKFGGKTGSLVSTIVFQKILLRARKGILVVDQTTFQNTLKNNSGNKF
uniref:Protein-lysine N-methyltransferase g.24743 n=2 Tax=Clastoptera arizonana TaxID=38151 RepID=A0A1B6BZS1_9HEMI